jgi:hypothetical protein
VLSTEYGLWNPNAERKPYDAAMGDKLPAETAAWHLDVASSIVSELWEPWERNEKARPLRPNELTVEIHAGKDYAQPLSEVLRMLGVSVELPCEGLGIGEQLAMYTSGRLSGECVANA